MEKKAIQYKIKSRPVNSSNVNQFEDEINQMLNEGWDVLSSNSIGLDTGGGNSSGGNLMMVATLVKYGYFYPAILEEPATPTNA